MAEIIAKRYGQALFDLAKEKERLAETAAEADLIRGLWNDNRELQEVMARPAVSAEAKKKVWKELLSEQASSDMLGLLFLLTDKGRLEYLPQILEVYDQLRKEEDREATAYVRTALPLTQEREERLRETLGRILGKKVTTEVTVDEDLMGGLVVRVGDKLFDSSLKTRLETLSKNLMKLNLNDETNTEVMP